MANNTDKKEDKIFSISEYIGFLNSELKKCAAKIIGEVGKVDIYPSGHVYFSLRDEKDKSVISCIIWKSQYKLFGIEIKEGVKIIATGRPDIYKQTGRLSFIAETIELAGEGILKKEYEKLKKKLGDEGIFEESKKRSIPAYPQKIGIITSKQGAVLSDFLSNIGNYGFKIKMVDSRVEGQSSITDLLSAIKIIKKKDIEVLIIMRGGGSFESLQPFNNELLVREVANFPVPVIAAIGHDKDVPLVSLAADLEVSTPSIAAITLSKSWKEAIIFLERYERNIIGGYENILQDAVSLINKSIDMVRDSKNLIIDKYKRVENKMRVSLQNFSNILNNISLRIDNLIDRSFFGLKYLILTAQQNLKHAERIISINSPERQLNLGYSIAFSDGKIIRNTEDTEIGKNIDLRVVDGTIISQVKNINKINKK
ncbi:exodeoxyribonuclease VII large subunit [Patescibacteria group bacterium]|nr:exodeoxyribonuclease VII large subunit [Patescibacteria group bacterium]MBU4368054.1 exodeoxyribonuclease VII large subunit [Patescibacteria group bacterium]MBU4462225.1 exodeoxyribonuclease VII large subunit [Patescibacteria group bacterium]MCG2699581.1 exodeoxyribonuclease VII large subunit [Candidatus Parcubacteria bacterium]